MNSYYFYEGALAYHDGYGFYDNPYMSGTRASMEWSNGWHVARVNDNKKG